MATAQVVKVQDKETKKPLKLATLTTNGQNVAVTNEQGEANISIFPDSAQIEIRSLGYQPEKVSYQKLASTGFLWQLTPIFYSLDQVVISATRWQQAKFGTLAKVTAISPKEFAWQNPQTMADVLGASGNVFIQKSQLGGGSPMIRGFSANRLLYTIDGVRMNNAIFRSGNLQNVIAIDPFAIAHGEVFFGPGSVMYGSDAIGAVMNFKTLAPKLMEKGGKHVGGNLVTRYAHANTEQTIHMDVNFGSERWAALTSVTRSRFHDLRMGANGPDVYQRNFFVIREEEQDKIVENREPLRQVATGYDQLNLMQKVRFAPSKKWEFEYGFHFTTTSDVPRYDRLIQLRNGQPSHAEWNYGPQVWMMNVLKSAYSGEGKWFDKANVYVAHQYFQESRIDRRFQSNRRRTRKENVHAFSLNADFAKTIHKNTSLFYGWETVVNTVASEGLGEDIITGATQTVASRYPGAIWASQALYATAQHKLTDRWSVQAGTRLSHFLLNADFSENLAFYPLPFNESKWQNTSLTGSLGFLYGKEKEWMISANLSTGFRAPNVDDIGKVFDSEPGMVVVPNPDVRSEYAYNAELGFYKVFGNALKLEFSGYITQLQNALVRQRFALNGQDSILYDGVLSGVQAVQNVANAQVMGLQGGLYVYMPYGLRIESQFNWQDGKEVRAGETSVPLRHAAPWFGMSRLVFEKERMQLQFTLQYQGSKAYDDLAPSEQAKAHIYAVDANGLPYAPSWYTLNWNMRYQLHKNISINTGIENITDQRYRTYSSGITGPGRNFTLALHAQF